MTCLKAASRRGVSICIRYTAEFGVIRWDETTSRVRLVVLVHARVASTRQHFSSEEWSRRSRVF